jgi:hypothetical protein
MPKPHPSHGHTPPATDSPPLTVSEVIAFESLPLGANGSRRAIVRWSDGSVGDALRWYDDEILIREADVLGRTIADIRRLHFCRDRDYLQSPGD